MNKTLEEAWELIESIADNHQCFKTRAASSVRGMYEIAPSDTTVLAKSLADITSMLREMKESQQATPKLLTHPSQSSPSPEAPPKHCGIYSWWRDNQQGRWNSNQQPQYRQPYNNNPPHNSQNTIYQPLHSRQPYPSNNNSQLSYEEAFRLSQQENKEMREVAKRTEAQISHLTDLITKFATQMLPSTSTPPPPNPSPLPSQPLPNPKGGINVVEKGDEKKEKKDARTEWLIDLIAKANAMVESDDEDWWDESEESDD
ncbi:hypothetical protein PIB30_020380 [Stylosanthes scabra]|uniref:Uncharacterized protein n=1 Tax=Stylosanthes scabra TaxID=79078 RepID=A0ABU6Q924_9FABA|nr:hypothetical protein [Stylosanthes scabra]